MKKAIREVIVSIAILIIFAAIIFFTGWTQFRIKANHFGILTSKTSGMSENPVEYGEFAWNWEYLLPTNVDLKIFQHTPYNIEIVKRGILPSSDVYRNSFSQKLDFSYSMTWNIELNVSQNNIIKLLKSNRIKNQEDLTEWISRALDHFTEKLTALILVEKESNPNMKPELLSSQELLRMAKIEADYPELEFLSVSISKTDLPDFSMYNKIRNEYISSIKYNDPVIIYADTVTPDQKSFLLNGAVKEAQKTKSEQKSSAVDWSQTPEKK